jgi:hypothetical protein
MTGVGVDPDRKVPALGSLWEDLGSDAGGSYAAVCRAIENGDLAVTAIKENLKPITPVGEAKVLAQVGKLDSEVFGERERASRALAELGPGAEPRLRKVLAESKSAEIRERVERILGRFAAEQSRAERALEILEMIHSAKAKRLLQDLAEGLPDATLTRAASQTLNRLNSR